MGMMVIPLGQPTYNPPNKTEEIALFNEKPIISKWVADIYDQKVTETEDVEFLLSVIGKEPKRILEKMIPSLIQFGDLSAA